MAVFILTWNPTKFVMPDEVYEDLVERTAAGFSPLGDWSMGTRRSGAEPGDVAFLLRQHSDRGLVAAGTIASFIYETEHWDGGSGTVPNVDVDWDRWLPLDARLPVEELLAQVPGVSWNRLQGSGTMVDEADGASLIALWEEHLARVPLPVSRPEQQLWILGEDYVELDAEFTVQPLGPSTELLTIESRGGGRNDDYIPAFRLVLDRAVTCGWTINDAFLASNIVKGLSEAARRIGDQSLFPRSGPGSKIADELRRYAAKMHREPGASGVGNATKRIEVVLHHGDTSRSLLDDVKWTSAVPAPPGWANEDVVVQMKIGEAAALDPTKRTEGLQRHARAQNALRAAVVEAGGILQSLRVNVDLAWRMPGDPVLYVAEVKGITPENQAGQMRLGLGQVTDFVVEATHQTGLNACPILFLSEQPTLPRWRAKAERADVELAWVGNLPAILAE